MSHLINYHYSTVRSLPQMQTLDYYIESFLKTAEDSKYPHYAAKAQHLKKVRDTPNRMFPYSVLLSGHNETHDEYADIIWKTLGPQHGECDKEYHRSGSTYAEHWVCPGIAVDEAYYEDMWNSATHGSFWKKQYQTFEAFLERNDEGPVTHDHCHIGDWDTKWLAKTGYDYCLVMYCFKREKDLNDFIVKATMGPQFEIMEITNGTD